MALLGKEIAHGSELIKPLVFDTEILVAVESLMNQPEKWGNFISTEVVCTELREMGIEWADYKQVKGRLELFRSNFLINYEYFLTDKGKETLTEWKERDAKNKD